MIYLVNRWSGKFGTPFETRIKWVAYIAAFYRKRFQKGKGFVDIYVYDNKMKLVDVIFYG